VSAGARWLATETISAELLAEAVLSSRPPVDGNRSLVPIEPRFTMLAGLQVMLPFASDVAAHQLTPEPEQVELPAKKDNGPTTGTLRGRVLVLGAPMTDVRITARPHESPIIVSTGADGAFEITELSPGLITIVAEKEGYKPLTSSANIEAGKTVTLELALVRALPSSQIRGIVRAFSGKPVKATIAVSAEHATLDLPASVETDVNGAFEISVPPGVYMVSIRADGYVEQQRKVAVELEGVTVLNIDLLETQ
jgi:hypothetical protein